MTNAVSVNAHYPTVEWPEPTAPEELGSGLSPDALIAYCQSRLDSIDGQVKDLFQRQQLNAAATQKIDQVMTSLQDYDGKNQTDPAVCKQLETEFQGLILYLQKNDPGCPELPALTTAYNSMVYSGDGGAQYTHSTNPDDPDFIDKTLYPPDTGGNVQGDKILGMEELQGYVQTLSDAAGNLNSDSELGMVHLQSLMSQRQTAVTLTTNLVQSLGDQENKIVDNIGH
jgi:hypothetical protein